MFNTPEGDDKEELYQRCCNQVADIDIPIFEVTYKDGRYQRQMLCLELGFYFGKRHTSGPEIYVRAGEVLYTDSQMTGMLYIPSEGCIPEINNGWRAVLATAGTILQITDHSMEKVCGESLLP